MPLGDPRCPQLEAPNYPICTQGVSIQVVQRGSPFLFRSSRHGARTAYDSTRIPSLQHRDFLPTTQGIALGARGSLLPNFFVRIIFCLNVSYVLVLLLCAFDLLRAMDSKLLLAAVPRLVLNMHAALHLVWQIKCAWDWRRSRL